MSNEPTFRATDAAYIAGIPVAVLSKLADAGCPRTAGAAPAAPAAHRRWSPRGCLVAAVGAEFMAGGMSAAGAVEMMRPSFDALLDPDYAPAEFYIVRVGGNLIGTLNIEPLARAVDERVGALLPRKASTPTTGRHGAARDMNGTI